MMRLRPYQQILLFSALCGLAAINLTPIIWGILTSLKEPVDAFSVPPKFVFVPTLKFHEQVWIEKEFWRFLLNSLILAVGTVLISVPIGTMAAYALARHRGASAKGILYGILAFRMFPHILLAIPFFVVASSLSVTDTYFAQIVTLVAVNQPFTIYLMRTFFLEVPTELYEAALIDGCTLWQTFIRVAVPIVRPGIWVTSLFSLLMAYNEFLFPLVLGGPHTKTLSIAIADYGAEDLNYWSLSAAAATGAMVPIIGFMILLQRHLVRGLAFGAVKG